MRGARTKLLVTMTAMALVVYCAGACTQDFDAFEGGTSVPIAADAAPDRAASANDAAANNEAATRNEASTAGCSAADPCKATRATCRTDCDTTEAACVGKCPAGGGCKKACQNAGDTCRNDCNATCRTCAGAACESVCN